MTQPAIAAWLREVDGAVILAVYVQPGARRTEVQGTHGEALKIRLAAPPVDGKANQALLHFLAEEFGVPQRAAILEQGERSRHKTVRILSPVKRPDRAWAASPPQE